MGMFGDLMGRIFRGGSDDAPMANDLSPSGVAPESRVQAANRQGVPVAQAVPGGAAPAQGPGSGAQIDVSAKLDSMAANNPEKLDWKNSIVDLMKLVGMDSSLSARRELADELNYSGDKDDSAAMNMWLHKEVMRRLAANGGKVPANLLD